MISSNIEIAENSIKEFIRVLIPEIKDMDIEANFKNKCNDIVLELKVGDKSSIFYYENLEEKIEDQKIIFLKTSLLSLFEKKYPWGGLIGVRPTKVLKRLLISGYSYEKISEILKGLYLVSQEKIELLIAVYKKEIGILNDRAQSIYIGIPFCPTRCSYCSFASFEIGSPVGERFYKKFVITLLEEIELTGQLIRDNNCKIESIYIGGGTPSTLTEEDLEKILKAIDIHIDKTNLKEFTFEAGREDSITDRKLEIAKEYGVDRVSLNPQTFNLEILKKLNRNFNRENFDRCYNKMKELGFIINMDLILGLPNESEKEILYTLETIKEYDIENLTIHSLALKKASVLFKDLNRNVSELNRIKVEDKVKEVLKEKGMEPYYLYRQKNSADWGENIGYSKPGFESIFNIEMIEENQSTIGLGGGAITKKITKVDNERDDIIRVINPKEPATYIREMNERFLEKIKLFSK